LDPRATTDSTSRIGAELFHAAAQDYAESVQPPGAEPRYEAPRSYQCLLHKTLLVGRLLDVSIHQTRQGLQAQSATAVPVLCSRRSPDNSFPRFQRRARST